MGDFERDTRVEAAGGGYRAVLHSDWEIWGPNGGYSCTFALRAVAAQARIRRPVAVYAHYLRTPKFAEVTLTVDALMQGRRSESFEVRMFQEGKPVLVAMVRTAEESQGLEHETVTAPDVPGPEGLTDLRGYFADAHPPMPKFFENFDVGVVMPERFAVPRPKLPPNFLEWYRFRSEAGHTDPFVDAARSLVLIDTLCWPATVLEHPAPKYFAPSLDVGVWFHRSATDSDWLLAHARSRIGLGGTIGANADVFSRDGKLVASGGTQLLCLPAERP